MHGNSKVGSHCVLSYIDIQDRIIPDNVVLHGLKQRDGKFIVRIFGVNDNPKENQLFGRNLDELEKKFDIKLWEDQTGHTLWSSNIKEEKDTNQEAV